MSRARAVPLALVLLLAPLAGAGGQGNPDPKAPLDYRSEFLNELAAIEEQYIQLAEAIPADRYSWRPAAGVRSVSEVFMHVAGANFSLPRNLGTPVPEGFVGRGFDTSQTDKAQVVATLRRSFAHLRGAVERLTPADADKTTRWFTGADNSYRGIMLFTIRHLGEHLGQAIAYARMNDVVPPWSAGGE